MNPLKLNLAPAIVDVTLEGPDGPKEYRLVEMSAKARDEYLDVLTTRVKTDSTGAVTVKKFEGLQGELLVRCLQHKEGATPVPATEIQSWPSSTVTDLFTAAQEINHLTKVVETPEKNG